MHLRKGFNQESEKVISRMDPGILLSIAGIIFLVINAIMLSAEPRIATPRRRMIFRITMLILSIPATAIAYIVILWLLENFRPLML